MDKIKFFILVIYSSLLLACNTFCNAPYGKYFNYSHENATNYIEFENDGTFTHYYKKDSIELTHKGRWEMSKNDLCKIELREFKNFNELGEHYEDYGLYLLFINGEYLDNGLDGNTESSFKKK